MSNSKQSSSGVALATAAALLFASAGAAHAQAPEAKIKCEGVNSCKGKSDCHTATHACQGMNACKGQGYLNLTQKDCNTAKKKMKVDEKKK